MNRKMFAELEGRSEAEQWRLLHEASREAFPHWRFLILVVPLALFFAFGGALGGTLPRITNVSNSFWLEVSTMALFSCVGAWVTCKVEVHYLRPILKRLLDESSPAAA